MPVNLCSSWSTDSGSSMLLSVDLSSSSSKDSGSELFVFAFICVWYYYNEELL